jgi:hypothetical protein
VTSWRISSKRGLPSRWSDVVLGAGEEVVGAEHVVAFGEQALAKVRAEKAGAAGDQTLQDGSMGAMGRIQIYVTLDAVGADGLAAFKQLDLGDILGCTGTLFPHQGR